MASRLLTRQEVAEWLSLPVGTLHNWAYRSEGPPFYKVGRHTRYDPDEVRAWLNERKRMNGTSV